MLNQFCIFAVVMTTKNRFKYPNNVILMNLFKMTDNLKCFKMSHFLLFNIPCSSNMQYFNLCVSYCRFDFRIFYCNSLELISSQYNYQVVGLHKILCQMIWCLLSVLASNSISAYSKDISVQFEINEFCQLAHCRSPRQAFVSC